jgi:hypothetical protein
MILDVLIRYLQSGPQMPQICMKYTNKKKQAVIQNFQISLRLVAVNDKSHITVSRRIECWHYADPKYRIMAYFLQF